MNIETIKSLCNEEKLRWTNHIFVRLLQRGISMDNVVYALVNGEIIESYPTDYPYPSCLVIGHTQAGNTLHVVCGASDTELWLITSYYPTPEQWSNDFKIRKEI